MEAEPFERACTFFACDLYGSLALMTALDPVTLAAGPLLAVAVEIDVPFDYDPPSLLEWLL
jgi:hypothetical protein